MKSIIGLFIRGTAIESAVEQLKKAGIKAEGIRIVSSPNAINKLFGCNPGCVIRNYLFLGAATGSGIYAIFGIAAALCECNLMQFGKGYGIFTFLGAILAGVLVGGIIGILVGADQAEKDTHLYVRGVQSGGRVISVQVPEKEVERVKSILTQENIRGLRVLSQEP